MLLEQEGRKKGDCFSKTHMILLSKLRAGFAKRLYQYMRQAVIFNVQENSTCLIERNPYFRNSYQKF